jgi:hypothetical protein
MGDDDGLLRTLAGRPAVWTGIGFLAIGVLWAVMDIVDASGFRTIMAVFWLLFGGAMAFVAVRDRRTGRGRYAPRASAAPRTPASAPVVSDDERHSAGSDDERHDAGPDDDRTARG